MPVNSFNLDNFDERVSVALQDLNLLRVRALTEVRGVSMQAQQERSIITARCTRIAAILEMAVTQHDLIQTLNMRDAERLETIKAMRLRILSQWREFLEKFLTQPLSEPARAFIMRQLDVVKTDLTSIQQESQT